MEGKRFDQLARAVATSGSRRRVLAGLLAGALGSLRIRTTSADDDGIVIADASGGDNNLATVVDPATGGNNRDRDRDDAEKDDDEEKDKDHDGERERDDCNANVCPPNPNPDPPEAGFCCPNGSCSCAGGCDCPDCWIEQLDTDASGEPLPPDQVIILREFCCFKCGGGPDACCSSCDQTGACVRGPDIGPIRGGSIRRR